MYNEIIYYASIMFFLMSIYFYMYYKKKIALINSYIGFIKLKDTLNVVIENEEQNIDLIKSTLTKNMNASTNCLIAIVILIFAFAIYLDANDFLYLFAPLLSLYTVFKNHQHYSSRFKKFNDLIK